MQQPEETEAGSGENRTYRQASFDGQNKAANRHIRHAKKQLYASFVLRGEE